MLKRIERAVLRAIVRRWMKAYPHSTPHPETVTMLVDGLEAAVNVSNARPEKYAHEPWLWQSTRCHAEHCVGHATRAHDRFGTSGWVSDLGVPEIAHAILRAMMCLHQSRRGEIQ